MEEPDDRAVAYWDNRRPERRVGEQEEEEEEGEEQFRGETISKKDVH